jgi:hypothetical protein
VGDLHSVVAGCNTDSAVIPVDASGTPFDCPGAPDGGLRHLTPAELRAVIDSFEPLGLRWKIEVAPTTALVVGTNKLVFGHQEPDGTWVIDRSTDTNFDLADASSTPDRVLPDGRRAFVADLLAPVLAAAAGSRGADLTRPLPLPDNLPRWAITRPAVRRRQASRFSTLRHLRAAVGDASVGPFATYLRAETGGGGPAPVALGPGWDAATWIDMDWRIGGQPVGLEVLTPDGLVFVGGDRNARRIVVQSVVDHLAHWLTDGDPSMEGPAWP